MIKNKISLIFCTLCFSFLTFSVSGNDEKLLNFIPEKSDGAVIFRTESLAKNKALDVLAEAGDIKRYKNDLDWIRNDLKAPYQDILIVIWQDEYGIIVSDLPKFPEMTKLIQKKYAPYENFTIKTSSHTGFDYISIIRTKKGKIKQYDLIYFGPDTAMLMGGKNKLPWKDLTPSFNEEAKKFLSKATKEDLIFGYIWNPKKIMDPLGLTRLMNKLFFNVKSSADFDDITITATAECTSERNAESVQKQMQGLGRILLIGMLGDNQKLMSMLDKAISFSKDNSNVTMKTFITKENMTELRKEYEKNPEMLQMDK